MAYSSLLIGGAHGAVLCLGENGHIAIEAAQNGDCNGFLPEFYLTDPLFPQAGFLRYCQSTLWSLRGF